MSVAVAAKQRAEVKEGVPVRKFIGFQVKEIDDEKKMITFRGTTPTPDRDGDIVVPQGCKLENYRKNPVFLHNHDWRSIPIGKSLAERVVKDEGIDFDIQFDESDEHAMKLYGKFKGGFMNAVSIGFMPLKWEAIRSDKGDFIGYKFTEWELFELSAVTIPANPDALQLHYAKFLEFAQQHKDELPVLESIIDLKRMTSKQADPEQKESPYPALTKFLAAVEKVAAAGSAEKANEAAAELVKGEAGELEAVEVEPQDGETDDLQTDVGVRGLLEEIKAGLDKLLAAKTEDDTTEEPAPDEPTEQEQEPATAGAVGVDNTEDDTEDEQEPETAEEDEAGKAFLAEVEKLGLTEEKALALLRSRDKEPHKPEEPQITAEVIANMVNDAVKRQIDYLSGKVVK